MSLDANGKYTPTNVGSNGKHYFEGGSFELEAADPVNQLVGSNKYRDIPVQLLNDYFSGHNSQEDTLAAIQKTPVYDPSKGPQIDTGNGPQSADIRFNPGVGSGFTTPAIRANAVKGGGIQFDTMTKEQVSAYLADGSMPKDSAVPTSPGKKLSGDVKSTVTSPSVKSTTGTGAGAGAGSSSSSSTPPGTPYPNLGDAPTFDAYQEEQMLRGTYGVDTMNTQIENIDAQIAALREEQSQKIAEIQSQPVSSRVMSKESSAASKGLTAHIQALNAQKAVLNKQVADANKAVSIVMSSMKTDYATAKSEWQKEYNANISYVKAFDAGTSPQQKNDKATLQGILNTMGRNRSMLKNLSPDQKNTIDQLVLSVYGHEFTGIEEAGISGVVYSKTVKGGDGKNYLQTLSLNPDGTIDMKYTGPAAGKGTPSMTAAEKKAMFDKADGYLRGIVDAKSGYINGADFMQLRSDFHDKGGDVAAFDTRFGYLLSHADKVKFGIK